MSAASYALEYILETLRTWRATTPATEVDQLTTTERGTGGFGSTGV